MKGILFAILICVLSLIPVVVLCKVRKSKVVFGIFGFVFAVSGFFIPVYTTGGSFGGMFDVPGFIGVVFLSFVIFLLSGQWDNFVLALKIVFKNEKFSVQEMEKAKIATSVFEKIIILVSLIMFLIGILSLFSILADKSAWGPAISLGLCSILYGLILCVPLAVFNANIASKIKDLEV